MLHRALFDAEPGALQQEIFARACELGSMAACGRIDVRNPGQVRPERLLGALETACMKGASDACTRLTFELADRRDALAFFAKACEHGSLSACEVGAGYNYPDLDQLVGDVGARDPVIRAVRAMRSRACSAKAPRVRCAP